MQGESHAQPLNFSQRLKQFENRNQNVVNQQHEIKPRGISPQFQNRAQFFMNQQTQPVQSSNNPNTHVNRNLLDRTKMFEDTLQQKDKNLEIPQNRPRSISPKLQSKFEAFNTQQTETLRSQSQPQKRGVSPQIAMMQQGYATNQSQVPPHNQQPIRPKSVSPQGRIVPQSPEHYSRRDSLEKSTAPKRKELSRMFHGKSPEIKQEFELINYYNNQQIQGLLQKIAIALSHLKVIIERGNLEHDELILDYIRSQLNSIYHNDLDINNQDPYSHFIYNESNSRVQELERLLPPAKVPHIKQQPTSPKLMTIEKMVSLYDGLKLGYVALLDKFEYFSSKSRFENNFNSLFNRKTFTLGSNWCSENTVTRKTIINFMFRLLKALNYLSQFVSRKKVEDETTVLHEIAAALKQGSQIQTNEKFMAAFRYSPAERRQIFFEIIPLPTRTFYVPKCNHKLNFICYEKVNSIFEGLESAFWMISDELDSQVYSEHQITDIINSALKHKFEIFPKPSEKPPLKMFNPHRGAPMRNVIQRMVVFLDIIRKELEAGKLITTDVFNWLKVQLFIDRKSVTLEQYMSKGILVYKPEHSVEFEINRLLPALNIVNFRNIPPPQNDEIAFSEVVRFYFKIYGAALRFIRCMEIDLYKKVIENQNWADRRLKACQKRHVLVDEMKKRHGHVIEVPSMW